LNEAIAFCNGHKNCVGVEDNYCITDHPDEQGYKAVDGDPTERGMLTCSWVKPERFSSIQT